MFSFGEATQSFIGSIKREFDFLGYRFSSAGLGIAPQTIDRFQARMARLYEQSADEVRIGQYAERWWRWVRYGVKLTDVRRAT